MSFPLPLLVLALAPASNEASIRCYSGEVRVREAGSTTHRVLAPSSAPLAAPLPVALSAGKDSWLHGMVGGVGLHAVGPFEGVLREGSAGVSLAVGDAAAFGVETAGDSLVLELGARWSLATNGAVLWGTFSRDGGILLSHLSGRAVSILHRDRPAGELTEGETVSLRELPASEGGTAVVERSDPEGGPKDPPVRLQSGPLRVRLLSAPDAAPVAASASLRSAATGKVVAAVESAADGQAEFPALRAGAYRLEAAGTALDILLSDPPSQEGSSLSMILRGGRTSENALDETVSSRPARKKKKTSNSVWKWAKASPLKAVAVVVGSGVVVAGAAVAVDDALSDDGGGGESVSPFFKK